ncbi:hypothetical protein Tco_0180073 [Tanacetum coccineum]
MCSFKKCLPVAVVTVFYSTGMLRYTFISSQTDKCEETLMDKNIVVLNGYVTADVSVVADLVSEREKITETNEYKQALEEELLAREPKKFSIMGEPFSPDRVFDFLMDEPEPHPAYDFFAPGPLPDYAGNPNNANGWIEADVPLLGEMGEPLGAKVDEPMVDSDIAMLFDDDDFSDDDSVGFEDDEEVWEVNKEWLMAPVTPPSMPVVPPPSTYEVGASGPGLPVKSTATAEGQSFPHPAPGLPVPPSVIEDLSTRLGNLEYEHGQLVKKVIQVSDAEVAAGITIREIGPRVSAVEGQVQVMVSQMVYVADRWEQALQAAVQQRDSQIQQLQTTVSEMSSRESTLMQCILGMDRRLADLERRPPVP